MPGQFNYEWRHKYPHLIGEDKEVWNRFLTQYPDKFETVDYDVHVGSGIDAPDEVDNKSAEQWKDLTRKRIDVVAWKGDFATIIEVKKRVGLATLGQVLGYRFLYLREHTEISSLPLLVLCSQIDKDDRDVLDHFGIKYIVV